MTIPSTELRAEIDEQNIAATNTILPSAVPIYRFVDGREQLQGSGTLFQHGDRRLLVTAAHVLESARTGDHFLTADLAHRSGPIRLEGRLIGAKSTDVAVLELSAECADYLHRLRFASLLDTFLNEVVADHYLWLCGFPQSWTKIDAQTNTVESRHFFYATGLYGGARDAFDSYDPSLHILLDVSRGTVTVDPNWEPTRVPDDLKGISGCGIWHAVTDREHPQGWRPKLVGVQTGVYNLGRGIDVAKGTRWFVVCDLLDRLAKQ